MVITFSALKARIMRLLDETAVTAPNTDTLVGELLNAVNMQRAGEFPWDWMLWPGEQTFSTVVGQKEYSLHQEFHRPLYFWDSTVRAYLKELPQRMLNAEDLEDATDDERFLYSGISCVKRQPLGSVVSVVSSSTSDISPAWVLLKGEDSSGDVVVESFTLTGTTTVVGVTAFTRILDVTKSDELAGTITLTDATGNVLLSLQPREMGRQYRTIELLRAPTSVHTIRYRFFRAPLLMVNDFDKPAVPGAHAQILVWDTLVMLSAYLTETNSSTISIWRDKQQEAQIALYTAYANEMQTIGAVQNRLRGASETGWAQ
jgi:hypothetical protein